MPEPLLRVRDVAEILGVSKVRVYQLIDEGRIPAVRISPRSIRVPRAAFDAWVSAQNERSVDSMRAP